MDCGSVQGLMEGRIGKNSERLSTPRKQWQLSITQRKAYHGHRPLDKLLGMATAQPRCGPKSAFQNDGTP